MSSASSDNEDFTPVNYQNLLDVEEGCRLDKLIRSFREKAGCWPDYVVCSPGRVNLIGDHVDYHGFPVLPMAIERSIWLCCSVTGDNHDEVREESIRLFNNNQETYPDWNGEHSLCYGSSMRKSHRWQNYFLCGYHGILVRELLKIDPAHILNHTDELSLPLNNGNSSLNKLNQFKVVVDSDLPPASGLSSSSALVCASAIATSLLLHHSNPDCGCLEKLIDTKVLADCCSKFEHLVGTHGGGMDQAVIMTAQLGYAKYVEFLPRLKCCNVRLPDGIAWLVSHCGVDYHKASTPGFNTRVLETKLGAAYIAKISGFKDVEIDSTIRLAEIKDKLFKSASAHEIVDHIRTRIFKNRDCFTVDEICCTLEMSKSDLIRKFNTTDELLNNLPENKLRLLSRCAHVFEEAERVERFTSICHTTTDIGLLGQLMTQSHYSLRDKYDCSHPALDRLVSIALDAGALGSRLTGAGWGGCIVTMVEIEKCDTVFDRLNEVSKFTLRTEPRSGCQIIRLMK